VDQLTVAKLVILLERPFVALLLPDKRGAGAGCLEE